MHPVPVLENLIRGSKVTMDEVLNRAPGNWYIETNQARSLGLVAEVLQFDPI